MLCRGSGVPKLGRAQVGPDSLDLGVLKNLLDLCVQQPDRFL